MTYGAGGATRDKTLGIVDEIAAVGHAVAPHLSCVGTTREGMEQPRHVWVPSIAVSGLMVYTGDKFPDWKGSIFSGGLAGEQIARLARTGDRVELGDVIVRGKGRVRDVRQGLDGFIYVAMESRDGAPTALVRLEPVARR